MRSIVYTSTMHLYLRCVPTSLAFLLSRQATTNCSTIRAPSVSFSLASGWASPILCFLQRSLGLAFPQGTDVQRNLGHRSSGHRPRAMGNGLSNSVDGSQAKSRSSATSTSLKVPLDPN